MRNILITAPTDQFNNVLTLICLNLMYGIKVDLSTYDNIRTFFKNLPEDSYQKYINFTHNRILDKSEQSRLEEQAVVNEMEDFEISFGYFRYLDKITNKKIINVTIEELYKDGIIDLISDTNDPYKIPENEYNVLAGADWPSYTDYLNGKIPDELTNNTFIKKLLDDWFYNLPTDKSNILSIPAADFFEGEEIIDKISTFIDCEVFDREYLIEFLSKYRKFILNFYKP